jgi:carbonic anhydrase
MSKPKFFLHKTSLNYIATPASTFITLTIVFLKTNIFFFFFELFVQLKWDGGAGYIEINGTKYVLKQCHWHSPSEHTINGQRFDLEAHMLHESSDGKISVVGILYKRGRPDSFLSSVSNTTKKRP